MAAVLAYVLLVVFVALNVAGLAAAAVARDGWHGWRHFWL